VACVSMAVTLSATFFGGLIDFPALIRVNKPDDYLISLSSAATLRLCPRLSRRVDREVPAVEAGHVLHNGTPVELFLTKES
jgi:hypothetical protein